MDKSLQIEFFNQLADGWDEAYFWDRDKLRCLVGLCGLKEGARILDAACGTGRLESLLLEKNPSYLLGVDFSQKMIDVAKARGSDPRLEYRCCDVMELSEEGVDCAIVLDAFTCFENRGSLIRQMHHLLAPGGRLMICHTSGRDTVNSHHQDSNAYLSLPLPAAKILTNSLDQYFNIDTIIDTDQLYAVSGTKQSQ